jgi:hypothetical protein
MHPGSIGIDERRRRLRLRRTTVVAALTVVSVIGTTGGLAGRALARTAPPLGDGVFNAIDKTLPGYGKDVAKTDAYLVHDMALGWYVVAAVERDDIAQARVAADQLLAVRHKGGTGATGWGLGWAWDAFGDGTINPAQAVYGISTAVAVRGLFDLYDATEEARYRDAAVEALRYFYERSFLRSTNSAGDVGVFWYSNQSYDRTWRVFNVISMLMGQYARAYAETGDATWKDVATLCFRYVWSHRKTTATGLKWDYEYSGSTYKSVNDGVHSSYIVQGMIDYEKYLPELYDITPAVDYLSSYDPTGQLVWSIGQLIFTLAEAGKTTRAEELRDNLLPAYRVSGYTYGNKPADKNVYVREMAQLAAGLSRLENPAAEL